jgi:hypothetical protein
MFSSSQIDYIIGKVDDAMFIVLGEADYAVVEVVKS